MPCSARALRSSSLRSTPLMPLRWKLVCAWYRLKSTRKPSITACGQAADQLAARGGLRIGVIQGCYDRRQTGANRSQRGAFDGLIAQPGIVAGFGVEAEGGQRGDEDGF